MNMIKANSQATKTCTNFTRGSTHGCILRVLGLRVPVLPPGGLRVLLEVADRLLVVVPDPRHADVEATELLFHTLDRLTLDLNCNTQRKNVFTCVKLDTPHNYCSRRSWNAFL